MSRKKNLILLFLILICLNVKSQYSIFEHYGVEDGLQSPEIYSQIQDNDGYMWFATSKGVSRFDGFEFKNFTMKDGLASNSIIKLHIDYKGRIWFSSYEGTLSYYENGKFFQHQLNDTIQSLSANYFVDNICLDTIGNLWFTPSYGGVYKIETDGNIYFDYPIENRNYNFFFKEIGENHIWSTLPNIITNEDTTVIKKINQVYYLSFNKNDIRSLRRFFAKVDENEFLISFASKLFYIKNETIELVKEFDNDISGIFIDNQHNYWISVMYEGIYHYENGNFDSKPEIFLSGKSPISVFQDKEGNYWMATTEDGIYFTSSFQFNTYNQFGFSDYNILSMISLENDLYFSTYDRQIFKCNIASSKITYIKNLNVVKNKKFAILDIAADFDGNIWFLGNELIKMNNNKMTVVDTISRAYGIYINKNNQVFVTYQKGFLKYFNNIIEEYIVNENISSSNAIFEDEDKTIYLGSLNGLHSFNKNEKKYYGDENPLMKSRINKISKINDFLILATSGEGLIFLKDTIIYQINKNNKLSSNFVNTIFVENDTVAWIGTNKGLCKINFNFKKDSFIYRIEKFSKSDGLYSEDIKSIAKIDDCIWLGTSKGLISFSPEKLKKEIIPPYLLLDSVMINDTKSFDTNFLSLKHNQNNITFFFKAISYRANQKIKYRYKLEGFDEKWIETENRYVRFPNLPAGNYKFFITASSEDENWNDEPIIINFKIKKHFSQTIVFIIFVLLFIGFMVYLILSFIYRNLRKDIENKRLLITSEQKALRSQMNPHFIFNSLNSIRRYILENDNDTADSYLTSFASLMRLVLENSKHNYIKLNVEIETLKRYLELERMRFDDSFIFKINVDKSLNTSEINIPPMLIQPYLENAIWHGLAPKKSDGILILNFEISKDEFLICNIEDNGIGRINASEIAKKRKNHTSTGLKNIEERLELINTITNSETTVEIIDLYDNQHKAQGTKVVIKIPYKAFL